MTKPTKYTPRSELGWSPSPAGYANPNQGLVVHYDSNDQSLANQNHSACLDYWESTRDYHVNGNGWTDVGYSFLACAHGYVIEGRGVYKQQAAQRGANSTHYSVTLATGPNDTITDEQVNAVRELRSWLMEPETSISGDVYGHRDFNSTSCPGDAGYRMVRNGTFAERAGQIVNSAENGATLVGLEKGDTGELVKSLQVRILSAGVDLPEYGVDGHYGDETAEGLRRARANAGSRAKAGYGDQVTGYAHAQLAVAVAMNN